MPLANPFGTLSQLSTKSGDWQYYSLPKLEAAGVGTLSRLPYSIRVLLEALLRNVDDFVISEEDVRKLAGWTPKLSSHDEIPFKPGRVVLQDFTGVPAVVDLAALRSAMIRMGGDPKKINPLVPCDLVVDHSVQVDEFATRFALQRNLDKEFERNIERYELLHWAQKAFDNFRVVPPATGIVHQVNLEYLAKVAWTTDGVVYPDSLVGTDSHTTMINGIGVLGWGVGGIEAEAVMLGQPMYMLTPEVVGFELTGSLSEVATATDLVLTVTEMLRKHGVVGKFVEFCGSGLDTMTLADRATIANMSPEYGATVGFFPVDAETLRYMERTGRTAEEVDLVEKYYRAQGLFRDSNSPQPEYTDLLKLDLRSVEPSMAGPRRPQDRIHLSCMQEQWKQDLTATFGKAGAVANAKAAVGVAEEDEGIEGVEVKYDGHRFLLKHGHVVIAAITSCTNTSNPSVMIGAGLLAKKAVEKGLTRKPWVKSSLAPGSRVVTDYLSKSGLDAYLDQLGFNTVGYGCTTCIGNSGPLPDPISRAINEKDLVAAAVLSGNRNFEGRISPDVRANYLASPLLVVAYALVGTVNINLDEDPVGQDAEGNPVYLGDIWPSRNEIQQTIEASMGPEQYREEYARSTEGPEEWRSIESTDAEIYAWNEESTYIQEPPFFVDMPIEPPAIQSIENARVLVMVGDSVTTDHISPAGAIKASSPAGQYLQSKGITPADFNSYGSRRGNDRVMTRGTFANIRLRNELAPGTEGGFTTYPPGGEVMSIYDAAEAYKAAGTPLVVLAGKEYGTGSSRDWAAKGTYLLGVRAVIAESYERIHRSNLVGMGVLPLQFREGETRSSLGLDGTEVLEISLDESLKPNQAVEVTATKPNGEEIRFSTVCRIDSPIEVHYYRNGGILHTVLRDLAKA